MTQACLRAVSESSTMIFGGSDGDGEVPETWGHAVATRLRKFQIAELQPARDRAYGVLRAGGRDRGVPFSHWHCSALLPGSMHNARSEPGAKGAVVAQARL